MIAKLNESRRRNQDREGLCTRTTCIRWLMALQMLQFEFQRASEGIKGIILYQKAVFSLDNTATKPIQARTLRPCPGRKMSNMSTSKYVGSTGEQSPNSKSSFDGSNTRRGKLNFHRRTAKPLDISPLREWLNVSPYFACGETPTGKLNPAIKYVFLLPVGHLL